MTGAAATFAVADLDDEDARLAAIEAGAEAGEGVAVGCQPPAHQSGRGPLPE